MVYYNIYILETIHLQIHDRMKKKHRKCLNMGNEEKKICEGSQIVLIGCIRNDAWIG